MINIYKTKNILLAIDVINAYNDSIRRIDRELYIKLYVNTSALYQYELKNTNRKEILKKIAKVERFHILRFHFLTKEQIEIVETILYLLNSLKDKL